MFNTQNKPEILIIGQSARILAEMAIAAGHEPLVIDCFGDADTRRLALDYQQVESLTLEQVQPAVNAFKQRHHITEIIYGSGFEQYSHTLDYLAEQAVLLGNPPALFRQIQHKADFVRQLQALNIPHPQTCFTAPNGDGWLFKPLLGAGGKGIKNYRPGDTNLTQLGFWQQYLSGQAMSITFIAADKKIWPLGINRQWTLPLEEQPFRFSGISSNAELSDTHYLRLLEWLLRLQEIYPMRGLGSLDFILQDSGCYVLEINPRIPASAHFYGAPVFDWHRQACLHGDIDGFAPLQTAAAYELVYAQQIVNISDNLSWPDWARDLPAAGAIIPQDQPICSIIATSENATQAEQLLQQRRQYLEHLLNIQVVKHHGISGQCQ